MMMERLGIDTEEYFEREDFEDIINFNTPGTLNALGFATSDIAEMGLTEIAKTVMSLERQNRIIAENRKPDYNIGRNQNTERSPQNERTDLHDAGRLQTAQFGAAETAGSADGTVLPNESEVPKREPQGAVLQSPDELQAERASDADRTDGDRNGGTPDERDGGEGRLDREPESGGYDELGSEDEQPEEPSSGNRDEGSNLRLEYYDRSNDDKSLPFFGYDDTIHEILATTPHLKATKDEIRAFYESVADEDKRTEYIKGIFNNDYTKVILGDGRRVGYKTYQNVLQLWEGSYLSRTKQSFYDWGVIAKHFEAMRLLGELQDTMKPLPSIDGQMSLMLNYEAEVTKPSAFSFSQEIIDAVLTRGSSVSEGKFRIYEQFQKSLSKKENVDFLKNEYGWGGSYPIITGTGIDEQHDGKGIKISKKANGEEVKVLLNWNQVEKRISEIIKMDRYLNPKEKELYPEWLEQHEIRRSEAAEERRKREILSTAPPEKKEPEPSNERYEYHLGNTVYIGANEYEILSFDNDWVMLYDTQFPLFNKEMSRADFDQKVQENPMNDHLKTKKTALNNHNTTPIRREDYIFNDPSREMFRAIYYNPDSLSEGKFVIMDFTYPLVVEASENTSDAKSFFEYLERNAYTELVDYGTEDFNSMLKVYSEPKPDAIGRLDKNMGYMIAEAQNQLSLITPVSERGSDIHYDIFDHMREPTIRQTEIDTLYEVLSRLKNDDISLDYDKNGLVATDSMGNEWHGQDFYKFIVEEAFVFEDNGGVLGIRDELLKDFTELFGHNGVPVKDNRVREPYRSYLAVKAENPDSLVLYQVGDFYDAYGEDAQKVAEALDLVMTSRAISDSVRVPMVGFPQHTLETYMNMLTDRGFDLTVSTVDGSECKVLSIVSQNKEAPVESKPIGRIDHLHTDGRVRESIEYTSPYQFEKDIKEENYYGVPMKIVLYKDRDGTTIPQDFISQLDPQPQGVEIIDSPYLKSSLDIAKEIIDEYCREEFERDEGADYSNLSEVNVAYTTTEDDKHEIQANVNLVDFKIETLVDGTVIRTEQYDSLEDMTERGLKYLSFDDLVYLSEEEIERVEKASAPVVPAWEQPKKSKVQTFDLHPEIPMSERHNFDLANNEITEVNKKERFHRNYAAITVLKRCQEESHFATPDEQKILSRYVGWGGIPEAFDERAGAWHTEYAMLKNILTPEEYDSARESTLTAFYTPPTVIKAVYKAMEQLGYREGNILEPSCGIGHFIGMLPESMSESKIYGVELDTVSAGIAQQLYQKTSIAAQGFEEANLPDSFFDAVVGNVPFGDFKVPDKRYDKHKFLIHDYFFAKSLDKLRPGGVMALITSKGTMDKENPAVRKYIAQRADLLGAIRLPNNTFKGNAGTEVVSDILILQKRDRIVDIEPDWVHFATDENGIAMNSYFAEHHEMILGEMKMVSGRFGPEPSCVPYEGADLAEQLSEAVANIHGEITAYEIEDELTEEDNSIPDDPTVRNFSYTLVDDKIYFRENSRMAPVDVSATAENRIKGMIAIRDCVRNLIELQTEDYPDSAIKEEQAKLNSLYDTFTAKYGLINSRANSSAFSQDSSFSLLSALEVLGDDGQLEKKADMFYKRTIKPHTHVTSVDTSSEALAVSMGEKACIDMEYMCELSGKTEEEIFADLKGVIFLNPMYGYGNSTEAKYLMADEYLSGNVREKLA